MTTAARPSAAPSRYNTGGFRPRWAGDQHRGAAHGLQLCQRQRAGAGNDEIGRCQQLGHVVDVLGHDQVFAGGEALLLFKVLKQLDAAAAGGVQMQRVPAGLLFPCAEIRYDLIDTVGTQAAAKAEDDRAVPGVQLGAGGGAVCRQDLGADRVADNGRFIRCAELFDCIGTGGQHDVDLSGKQLVRHAGESVLLMDGRLDAAARGGADDRPADIAAAADD